MGRGGEGERLERERGLINFLPLKRVGGWAYWREGAFLRKRALIIEDLWH